MVGIRVEIETLTACKNDNFIPKPTPTACLYDHRGSRKYWYRAAEGGWLTQADAARVGTEYSPGTPELESLW